MMPTAKYGDRLTRILSAILFVSAISALVRADCQPDKDDRTLTKKSAGIGVVVVEVNLSGAISVDSAELTKITDEMVGSCFDNEQTVGSKLVFLFQTAGYLSVRIEDLQVESINPGIAPAPVQVKGNVIEGQKCPTDVKGLHQFLLDHRSNSLDADPKCVDGAFSAMGSRARFQHDRYYIKALIELLDFERIDEDPGFSHHLVLYPAAATLILPAAVPSLVSAIKESDSELVRTNAAYTMFWIYRECTPAAVTKLKQEGDKAETTPEQRTRLQVASEYVENYFPDGPGPCKSPNGEPTTEKKRQRELDTATD